MDTVVTTSKRSLSRWEDAHACDTCAAENKRTLATHGTTDMVEVAPNDFKESPRMRFGCADHKVVAQRVLLDGTSTPWEEPACP